MRGPERRHGTSESRIGTKKAAIPLGITAFSKRETGIEFGIAHKPYKIKEESTLSMSCPQKCPHNSILSFSTDGYIVYLIRSLFSKYSLL